MFSTGSEGNMRGIKKIKVTPIRIVSAHARIRCRKKVLNFTASTPLKGISKPPQPKRQNKCGKRGAVLMLPDARLSSSAFKSCHSVAVCSKLRFSTLHRRNVGQHVLEAAPPPPRTVVVVLGVWVALPVGAVGRHKLRAVRHVDKGHILHSLLQELNM